MAPEQNVAFLGNCLRSFPHLNLVDQRTGRIYVRFAAGSLQWVDYVAVEASLVDDESRAALRCAVPDLFMAGKMRMPHRPTYLAKDRHPTIGRWGYAS
jgi:hypothetical protein